MTLPAYGQNIVRMDNIPIGNLDIVGQAGGDLIYFNGAAWARLPVGNNGDLLQVVGGIPTWAHVLQNEINGLTIGVSAGAPEPDNNKVHIWDGTAGAVVATAGTILALESNSVDGYLSILGPTSAGKGIVFGEPGAPLRGQLLYRGSADAPADTFSFFMATNERLRYSAGAFAFQEATIISTTVGNLSLFAVAGADVLIGHGATPLLYVDGGFGTLGFFIAATATELITIAGIAPVGVGSGVVFYPTLRPGAGASSFGFNVSTTIQEAAGGNHTLLASFAVQVPTITAGVATVMNTAAFYVAGPAVAVVTGANYSFWIDAGPVRLDGRVLETQGADVASANDLTLGDDGNDFEITGAVQINRIVNTGWQNGSLVTLLFTSNPVVAHGQASGGANITILLAGSVNFGATAGDTLTLLLSEIGGTQAWREVARTAI